MRPIYLAVSVAALCLSSSVSAAAPFVTGVPEVVGIDVIQVHSTCHQNNRTHNGVYPSHTHVPGFPGACGMIVSGGGGGVSDCHANYQNHWLPGSGNVVHRHVGNNCAVDTYGPPPGGSRPGFGGCFGNLCFYGN